MSTIRTGVGLVQRHEDGRVVIIRSMPSVGTFLSLQLTAAEVAAIREMTEETR